MNTKILYQIPICTENNVNKNKFLCGKEILFQGPWGEWLYSRHYMRYIGMCGPREPICHKSGIDFGDFGNK